MQAEASEKTQRPPTLAEFDRPKPTSEVSVAIVDLHKTRETRPLSSIPHGSGGKPDIQLDEGRSFPL